MEKEESSMKESWERIHVWEEIGTGDWQVERHDIYRDVHPIAVCCGEKRVKPDVKALNLQVILHFHLYLWSWAVGGDQKNEIVNMGGQNKISLQGGRDQPGREGAKLRRPGEAERRAALPLHQEEPAEVVGPSGHM